MESRLVIKSCRLIVATGEVVILADAVKRGWFDVLAGGEGDKVEVRLQNTWFVCSAVTL